MYKDTKRMSKEELDSYIKKLDYEIHIANMVLSVLGSVMVTCSGISISIPLMSNCIFSRSMSMFVSLACWFRKCVWAVCVHIKFIVNSSVSSGFICTWSSRAACPSGISWFVHCRSADIVFSVRVNS